MNEITQHMKLYMYSEDILNITHVEGNRSIELMFILITRRSINLLVSCILSCHSYRNMVAIIKHDGNK